MTPSQAQPFNFNWTADRVYAARPTISMHCWAW